jgi:hypothetical protein
VYDVNNVEAAADQLVKWTKRGPKWNKAVRVCLAALAGELTPEDGRVAFKSAAKEEGMLVALRQPAPKHRSGRHRSWFDIPSGQQWSRATPAQTLPSITSIATDSRPTSSNSRAFDRVRRIDGRIFAKPPHLRNEALQASS